MTYSTDSRVLAVADVLLQGRADRDPDFDAGAELYRAVADAGDPVAMLRSAVFAAEGLGRAQNWVEALALLTRAAELGETSAQRQLRILAGTDDGEDWRHLLGRVNLHALLTPPRLERLTDKVQLGIARTFAPWGFAEWLIERARDTLQRGSVHDLATGDLAYDEGRTALQSPFGALKRDMICAVMEERAARLCRIPIANHEPVNVISYEVGQQFGNHYDFVPTDLLAADPRQAKQGQRTVTLVTYLNDDFEGGETEFPAIGMRVKGGVGDAIVWSNVRRDGEPDRSTLHAGLPPTRGRKWVLSQWIRNRPQAVR